MGAGLLNTAIERLLRKEATSGEQAYDGMVRNAKDIAAAGVFVCAAACVAVAGACIFIGNGVLAAAIKFCGTGCGLAWRLWSPCRLRFGSFFPAQKNSIIMENGNSRKNNGRK